ncbi:chitinase 3 [Favolaschia claudopus]|uniref:Chitinase 3 n=1 Tax=Favolaschia claudopus TaxID=2862362 RepID=A0AAW0AXX9_9AGAR
MYFATPTWLAGLLLSMTTVPTLVGPARSSFEVSRAASASPPKRIVQYYGSPLAVNNHVHIAQILDFAWDEMKQVQKAGVPVSMFLRAGFHLLNDASKFEALYAPLHTLITNRKFDGIDLDIENDAITLATTVKLIRRLRADFGKNFIITLAPVATALAGGINLSSFSYTDLEKEVGSEIAWYKRPVLRHRRPDRETLREGRRQRLGSSRFTIGMASSHDFNTGTFPLSDLHPILANITKAHPKVAGMAGFDYYDQCPGGWGAPWQWPIWAAVQMGDAQADATKPFSEKIQTCGKK